MKRFNQSKILIIKESIIFLLCAFFVSLSLINLFSGEATELLGIEFLSALGVAVAFTIGFLIVRLLTFDKKFLQVENDVLSIGKKTIPITDVKEVVFTDGISGKTKTLILYTHTEILRFCLATNDAIILSETLGRSIETPECESVRLSNFTVVFNFLINFFNYFLHLALIVAIALIAIIGAEKAGGIIIVNTEARRMIVEIVKWMFLVFGIVIALINVYKLIRFYNYSYAFVSDGIVFKYGVRSSKKVDFADITAVTVRQNLVARIFGFYRVYIKTKASGTGESSLWMFPLLIKKGFKDEILSKIIPDSENLKISRAPFKTNVALLVFLGIITILTTVFAVRFYLNILLFIPVYIYVFLTCALNRGNAISDDVAVFSVGNIELIRHYILIKDIESITTNYGVINKLVKAEHLNVFTYGMNSVTVTGIQTEKFVETLKAKIKKTK